MSTELEIPKTTVSHSEVDSYCRCPRAHFYGYGMGIQRIQMSDSLIKGTLGHASLEAYFKSKMADETEQESQIAAGKVLMDAMQDPKLINIAAELVKALSWFFRTHYFDGWKIIAVEQEYVLPVIEGFDFPFVIDLMAEDPYGDIWVIDHKFMYDFITDRDAELQSQLPKYVGALRALGVRVDKAGYNVIRTRTMKDETIEKKWAFLPTTLTDARISRTFVEQTVLAVKVQEIRSQPLEVQSAEAVRVQNKMICNSCQFRGLCVAELNGYQANLILNSEYKPRERRDFAIKEIEA